MTRRDFRTPSTLPETTQKRCITIPASQEWLGLVNAALLMLTEAWRYDQVEETDLTPSETAAIAYDMYVAYLAECEGEMSCEDVLSCMLPWLQSEALLDGDIRLDPITDQPQVSYDGGVTWSDIPNTGAGIQTPTPTTTPGSDDDERKCLASTRAAMVIAEFYKQTFGAFTADLLNTLGSINNFLHSVNMSLFNAIYSPYQGVIEAAGWFEFDFETNYTAGELTTEQIEELTCLLLDNSTVENGVVSFNYAPVLASLTAALGTNPGVAVALLVSNMQAAGLQSASLVNVTSEGNCAHCDPVECDDTGTPASLFTIFNEADVWTPVFAASYLSCGAVYQGDWGAAYGTGYDQVVLSLPENLCIYRIDAVQVYRPNNAANRITSVDTYVGTTLVSSGVNVSTTNCVSYTMWNDPSNPVQGDSVKLTFPSPAAGILRMRGITVYYYEP